MKWKPACGKPIVVVQWEDADAGSPTTAYAESEIEGVHRTTLCETVGYLLRHDDRGVTVFDDAYEDGGQFWFRGRTFIPAGMVKAVTVLAGAKRPPARSQKQPRQDVVADQVAGEKDQHESNQGR